MKSFLMLILLAAGVSAAALVPLDNALVLQDCGDNALQADDASQIITRVCLARVQSLEMDFLVFEAQNGRQEPLPAIVVPILKRTKIKEENPDERIQKEILVLATQELESTEPLKYKTIEVELTSQLFRRQFGMEAFPKSMTGRDLTGTEFRVDQFGRMTSPEPEK